MFDMVKPRLISVDGCHVPGVTDGRPDEAAGARPHRVTLRFLMFFGLENLWETEESIKKPSENRQVYHRKFLSMFP